MLYFFKTYKKYLPFSFVNDAIFTNENGKGEIVMDDIQKVEKLLRKNNGVIETYQVEQLGINNKVLTRMIEKSSKRNIYRCRYI